MAERTWRHGYATILSREQMDYMLARMYAPEVIAREMEDGVIWEIASTDENDADIGSSAFASPPVSGLRSPVSGLRSPVSPVGFHSCAFDSDTQTLKLNKLYVLPDAQGMGFGKALLSRVRELAGILGARKIWLQVNKQNATAIRAYERAGYSVERSAVFDIGGGFVMDDFIMALAVPAAHPLSTKDATPERT
jgi:GNAT superfamily N-acetyltransferase